MKKSFLIVYLSAQSIFAISQTINVNEARRMYANSGENKEVCKKLYEKLSEIDEKNQNLLLGYKGAVMAEMAKHSNDAQE